MKAWSRSQNQGSSHHPHQNSSQSVTDQYNAQTDLINSYLNSQYQYQQQQAAAAAAAAGYGGGADLSYVPPPAFPGDVGDEEGSPLPPPRSSSSHHHGGERGGGRNRGKRSRHTTASAHHEQPITTGRSSKKQQQLAQQQQDLNYQAASSYDLYNQDYGRGYNSRDCGYQTKYGEDCQYQTKYSTGERYRDYSSKGYYKDSYSQGGGGGAGRGTWPKQPSYGEDPHGAYTQDDQNVQYLQELEENARLIHQQQQEHNKNYAQVNKQHKKRSRQQQQQQQQAHHQDQYDQYYAEQQQPPPQQQSSKSRSRSDHRGASPGNCNYSQEQLAAEKLAQEVVQCTKTDPQELTDHKYLESTTGERQQQQAEKSKTAAAAAASASKAVTPPAPPPLPTDSNTTAATAASGQTQAVTTTSAASIAVATNPTGTTSTTVSIGAVSGGPTMETFKPTAAGTGGTLQRQTSGNEAVQMQQEHIQYVGPTDDCCQVPQGQGAGSSATLPAQPTATLSRSKGKKAATASQFNTLERNMAEVAERNRASERQLASAANTLDRRHGHTHGASCDTCDAPLTPASLAGIDQRELEHRPLTRSVTRATMYDDPPEKTSLFIICSGFYALLLVVICAVFLTAEIATNKIPLHYFEVYFTYLYMGGILYLLYVFCYLLNEGTCCGDKPPRPGTTVRNAYFHNLPRDALPDGSPIREKLANLRRPRKYKTSENDFSHGSFFLRIGGIAFGLGTMVYNGMEMGTFFEIPWNSPCYQVLRGINPILQMVFTFSQMYFVFMNARLNIHRFKFLSRFGLAHIVATDLCVWLRTLIKECVKEVALFKSRRGEGVTEDYMILEGYNYLRRVFGPNSFFVNGPYHALMNAIAPPNFAAGSGNPFDTFVDQFSNMVGLGGMPGGPGDPTNGQGNPMITQSPPISNALIGAEYPQALAQQQYVATQSPFNDLVNVMNQNQPGVGVDVGGVNAQGGMVNAQGSYIPRGMNPGLRMSYNKNPYFPSYGDERYGGYMAFNHTCTRNAMMGQVASITGPYLYPFVIEYSFIAAAVILAMWKNVGKNPRFWGEEDDHVSVASKKLTYYAKTDCVGASKGLFFGLLTLICGLICLILFFVLIHHNNTQVSQLAVFLADSSHGAILIVAILATLLGFLRIQKLKFHGEDQSSLANVLLLLSSCGIFAYSGFNIVAGGLGEHTDMKNLLVFAVGAVTIIQVMLQLLFITDAQRRRISTATQNTSKPGRQVVTFLLICNLTMWVLFTFEVKKVQDNPVQLRFFGITAWTVIQRVTLPLCIFFRFHSTVILADIWKNSYKAKIYD